MREEESGYGVEEFVRQERAHMKWLGAALVAGVAYSVWVGPLPSLGPEGAATSMGGVGSTAEVDSSRP